MAKQVVATMDIMHDGEKFPAGQPVDPKKFSKDQLTRLYERGAVRIDDSVPAEEAKPTMDEGNSEESDEAQADQK